jgi:hypothetical protein
VEGDTLEALLGEYHLNPRVFTLCRYLGKRPVLALCTQLYNELIIVDIRKECAIIEEARMELA